MNVTTRRKPTSHKKDRPANKPPSGRATTSTDRPSDAAVATLADLAVRIDQLELLHKNELAQLRRFQVDQQLLNQQRERRAAKFNEALESWKAFIREHVEPCEAPEPGGVAYPNGVRTWTSPPPPDLTFDGEVAAYNEGHGGNIADIVSGEQLRIGLMELIREIAPNAKGGLDGTWVGARIKAKESTK